MATSLIISAEHSTARGHARQRRKYQVVLNSNFHPDTFRAISLSEYAKERNISLSSLLQRIRSWSAGTYYEQFVEVVRVMKANRESDRFTHRNRRRNPPCKHCGRDPYREDRLVAEEAKSLAADPEFQAELEAAQAGDVLDAERQALRKFQLDEALAKNEELYQRELERWTAFRKANGVTADDPLCKSIEKTHRDNADRNAAAIRKRYE